MENAKNKKEETIEKVEFTEQEAANLEQVFTLARLQMVTTNPGDKKSLVDLINFEQQFIQKLDINGNNGNNTRK